MSVSRRTANRIRNSRKQLVLQAIIATKKNVVVKLTRALDRRTALVTFEDGRPTRTLNIDDYLNNFFDADSTDTLYAYVTLRTPGVVPDGEMEIETLLEGEAW